MVHFRVAGVKLSMPKNVFVWWLVWGYYPDGLFFDNDNDQVILK